MTGSRNEGERIRRRIWDNGPRRCSVAGCSEPIHRLGQLCRRHGQNAQRHGGPQQRAIRLQELRTYFEMVDRFTGANAGHPALELAYDQLYRLLQEASAIRVVHRPGPREWRTRLRLELQRLHANALTGQEMFRLAAGLHLFAHYQPRSLAPWSREFWFQLARIVLNARQRDPQSHLHATWQGSRLPGLVLENLGRNITVLLAQVLRAMVTAIEQDARAPQAHQQQINEL
jgi:hypothetical protein